MKKISLLLSLFTVVACLSFAHKPAWLNESWRGEIFPQEQYFVGFATSNGANSQNFIDELKARAKSELVKGVKDSAQSVKQQYKSTYGGAFSEEYSTSTSTSASPAINGLKIDYHYDSATQVGYAFAYANKYEVKGYYKATVLFTLQKIEITLHNAKQTESDGKKSRARHMYKAVKPLFRELDFAQSLLMAAERSEVEGVQMQKTLALQSELKQALLRLHNPIVVYIKSSERNLSQVVHLLEPRIKEELSNLGYNFTSQPQKASWLITINASTHRGNCISEICFSYLNASVSLVESTSGKDICRSNIANLKGGGLGSESAGLSAYNIAMQTIMADLAKSLEK